jgi:hypothetical protein
MEQILYEPKICMPHKLVTILINLETLLLVTNRGGQPIIFSESDI